MKLFFERLFSSIKEQVICWSIAIALSIPLMIAICGVAFIIFILPILVLQMFIGDYAALWIIIAFIVIGIIAYWGELKKWFIWQFIEPFKKKDEN